MDYLEITTKPAPDEPDVELVEIKGDHTAFQWLISAAGNARDGFTATADEVGGDVTTKPRRRLVLEPQTPNEIELKRRERLSIHNLHERNAELAAAAAARPAITLTSRAAELMGAEQLAELAETVDVRIEEPAVDLDVEDASDAHVHPGHGRELEGVEAPVGVAGEPPREVELEPVVAAEDLTTHQLGAILRNDVEAFPHAGRYEVPRALAELERRRDAGHDDAGETLEAALERGRGDTYEGASS